jgi:arylsulfatase A-like enzyme
VSLRARLSRYSNVETDHAQPVPKAQQHELRRAYYAAITHVDDQVGRLLGVLRNKGLFNQTLIVLVADHVSPASVLPGCPAAATNADASLTTAWGFDRDKIWAK